MWFLVALACVVVAAQPQARDWPVDKTAIRPRWEHRPAFPNPVGPLYPNGPEQRPQDPSDGSQNGGERGYESRPGFSLNQGTKKRTGPWHRWETSSRNSKAHKTDRMPMRPTHTPVGEDRQNPVNPLFGRPLSRNMMDNRQFIPIFKADNVTVQNVSAFNLKEGENVFLLPKSKGQMQPPKKGGGNKPQEMEYGQGFSLYSPQPYVKIIFNPNTTPRISFEYGITQLLPAFMKAETETDVGTN